MDDIRFIRENEVQRITGLSRTTRWRLEREGKFPLRRQLSENSVAWIESEIRDWFASRNVRAAATQAAA
jgi:prophage regulatory protein